MTSVRFDYRKPNAVGQEVSVKVVLRFALLKRKLTDPGIVTTTNWFDVTVFGPTIVGLAPTEPGQAWQMLELRGVVDRKETQTFLVPDTATVLEFDELEQVDPSTLN